MNNQSDLSVIIVGAGGHGKVVAEALRANGASVLGFTDSNLPPTRTTDAPPILGDDSVLETYDRASIALAMGIGSTRPGDARDKIYERISDQGFRFVTVTHPSATIASDVVLEDGCQIMAGAIVQPGCRIGTGAIINTRASVDHDCTVGRFVHVAPGATLSGGVRLDDGCHVGVGATVIQNVSIGSGAFVTAGAVVTFDLQPNERYGQMNG